MKPSREDILSLFATLNNGIVRGSQMKAAKALNTTEVVVSRWVKGISKPSEESVCKLAKLFGKSEEEIKSLFCIKDIPNAKRYAFAAETQLIPVIGVSSASNMMFILEEKKGYLTTKKEGPDDFAIEVLGHCMEDPADPRHSIYHGDTIIVRPDVPVKDGDVVVARIGEESTIKRIYFNKKDNTVDLQPDNPKFKTLYYPACEVEIVGKVIKKDEPIISKKRRENK